MAIVATICSCQIYGLSTVFETSVFAILISQKAAI